MSGRERLRAWQVAFQEMVLKSNPETARSLFHLPNPQEADLRLGLYHRSYASRLARSLSEDFPRVAAVLGEERTAALWNELLSRIPSQSWTLAEYSAEVPGFVSRHPIREKLPFLPDLAALEWLRVLASQDNGPDEEFEKSLAARSPEAWASARIRLNSGALFLSSDWDLLGEPACSGPTPAGTRCFVVCQAARGRICERELSGLEQELWSEIEKDRPLGDLAQALVDRGFDGDQVSSLIAVWIREGLIEKIIFSEASPALTPSEV